MLFIDHFWLDINNEKLYLYWSASFSFMVPCTYMYNGSKYLSKILFLVIFFFTFYLYGKPHRDARSNVKQTSKHIY